MKLIRPTYINLVLNHTYIYLPLEADLYIWALLLAPLIQDEPSYNQVESLKFGTNFL